MNKNNGGYEKMDKGMIKEVKKNFCKLTYSMRIMEKASVFNGRVDVMEIKGIAVAVGISRNGIVYEAEELKKAAKTLENKPLLLDHEAKIDNIVGKVVKAEFDGMDEVVRFVAEVMDDDIREMIKDGRITDVSIGALVKEMKENDDGNLVAKGIEFVELSLVSIPGIASAKIDSFDEGLNRALIIRESLKDDGLTELERLEATVEVARMNIFKERLKKELRKDIKLNSKVRFN